MREREHPCNVAQPLWLQDELTLETKLGLLPPPSCQDLYVRPWLKLTRIVTRAIGVHEEGQGGAYASSGF